MKYPARTRDKNNLTVGMLKQLCITLFGFLVEEDHGGHSEKLSFINKKKILKIVLIGSL